jgi:hypothetical protein
MSMSSSGLALLDAARYASRDLVAEVARRHRALAIYGFLMAGLMGPTLVLMAFDERTTREVGVWAKPLKFMASTALFSLSTAWFMDLLPESVRTSPANRAMAWTVILTSAFEVAYISIQAALGAPSHYNVADRFHAAMFGLMAVAAVMLTGTQAFLAWQIFVHGVDRPRPVATQGVIVGLVLTFVLATASGFMLGGSQPPAGVGLPLVGWHVTGGDIRPAHFLGVHAQQFIPLAGFLLQRSAGRSAGFWLAAFVTAYSAAWLMLTLAGLRA